MGIRLKNVPGQVGVRHNVGEPLAHVGAVDDHGAGRLGGIEADVLQYALEHGMEPAGADIFGLLVHRHGEGRELLDCVLAEFERHAIGGKQCLVLLHERILRLRQNRLEIFGREGIELDPNRQPSLQLGNQIGGLADVEGAGRDKQDVVGLDRAVLRVHRRALDDWKDVALYSLPRNVGPTALMRAGNLVDLVDEDDAVLAGAPQRLALDGVTVDQLCRLFLLEDPQSVGDGDAFFGAALRKNPAEHFADVPALIEAAPDDADREARRLLDLDLDQAYVVEAAFDFAACL